jgi:2-oxoglutarate ferredoxin oxidoreductase subunit alpha
VGGLEKANITGNVNYEADNHELMVKLRGEKVANIAKIIPAQQVLGPHQGELLVVSWGGTKGACQTAVQKAQELGISVAHCHLRHLNPFPSNLGEILASYDKILVPELNLGQLRMLLRDRYLINAMGFNKVKGKPFTVSELLAKIKELTAVSSNGRH